MGFYNKFYSRNYKLYLIVPIVLFVVFLIMVFGVGVKKGIDLSGGTQLTVYTSQLVDSDEIKSYLQTKQGLEDVTVSFTRGIETNRIDIQYLQESNLVDLKRKIDAIKGLGNQAEAVEKTKMLLAEYKYDLETSDVKQGKDWVASLDLLYNNEKNKRINEILSDLGNKFGFDVKNVAIKEISPTLSESFYNKALWVALFAIIGIIVVIFLAYRELIPSLAIILCAFLDVLGGLAGMAIFGVPLSLVTIPALLMLLGYSIDTDIMLTTKLLKRSEGSKRERAADSMRTGIIMTTTTLGALIVMLVFSSLYNVSILFDIGIVLICGLIVDLLATWTMNGPILLWYVENKK